MFKYLYIVIPLKKGIQDMNRQVQRIKEKDFV
jgi:hypothetical protein